MISNKIKREIRRLMLARRAHLLTELKARLEEAMLKYKTNDNSN